MRIHTEEEMNNNNELIDIQKIYNDIRKRIIKARAKIYTVINNESIDNCWYIGKIVVELQNGNPRAEYGKQMIKALSEKLTNEFGAGFSMQNIRKMRQFYEAFPIRSTVSSELSWSHYQELAKIVREEEIIQPGL